MNFTFKCIHFNESFLDIQIHFKDPQFISNYAIDKIVIRVLDDTLFTAVQNHDGTQRKL